jgi:hypothetical protein
MSDPKAKKMNWISVEDRLPENRQLVEYLHHGHVFKGIFLLCEKPAMWIGTDFLGEYMTELKWSFQGTYGEDTGTMTSMNVTHWRALPEVSKD